MKQFTMKALIYQFLFVLLFSIPVITNGQDAVNTAIQDGVTAYENGNYEEALSVFLEIETPQGQLLAGQTYYQMGKLADASRFLTTVLESSSRPQIITEAAYSLALIQVAKKNFTDALQLTHRVSQNPRTESSLRSIASSLKESLLRFISLQERINLLSIGIDEKLLVDVIRFGVQSQPRAEAVKLLETIEVIGVDTTLYNHAQFMTVADQRPSSVVAPSLPEGFMYRIGILLPYKEESTGMNQVSGSLYKGMLLAIQKYNTEHPDSKIFVDYLNPKNAEPHSIMGKAHYNSLDLLVGPLTSATAYQYILETRRYKLPMIAPLANSDTLNLFNPYFFQANPTFGARGQLMANYAYKTLGVDTVSVIAHKNSEGIHAASSFRETFADLGGTVQDYFVRDFDDQGYEITEFTDPLTSNKELIDSLDYTPIDAVYAPFTGPSAPSLIDLLLTDLKALNSEVTVLASEDWRFAGLEPDRIGDFNIYYLQSPQIDEEAEEVINFRKEYSDLNTEQPNQFSFKGYDLMNFVISVLEQHPNPNDLDYALRNAPEYQGLGNLFHFRKHQVNHVLPLFKLLPEEVKRIR